VEERSLEMTEHITRLGRNSYDRIRYDTNTIVERVVIIVA